MTLSCSGSSFDVDCKTLPLSFLRECPWPCRRDLRAGIRWPLDFESAQNAQITDKPSLSFLFAFVLIVTAAVATAQASCFLFDKPAP